MELSQFKTVEQLAAAIRSLLGSDHGLVSSYLSLPLLKGFWPMASISSDSGPIARDLSGNELHLTNVGTQFGWIGSAYDPPCANFGAASTDRLYRTDEANFHTSFTASGLISANRGLTAGCWVRFADFGNVSECVMGIWDSGDREWMIYANSASQIGGYFSYDGTNYDSELVGQPQSGVVNDEWNFLCLQVSPTAQEDVLRMWINNYSEEKAHGRSALNDANVNFGLGHNYTAGSPDTHFEGQISMAFLCGGNIGSANIQRIYSTTRSYFKD